MDGASNPVAWREVTLGEILPLKYGKARSQDVGYPRSETQTFGSNGAFGTFDRALTEKPSIIVGRKGAAGLVHYSAEPCWPIDTAFYTEGSDKTYLPFFRYLLESLRLGQFDRSTAIPSLSRDDYNARKIAYPERLEEQQQIVAEIEKQFTRLDAGVAALRRVQANLKRYRAAVLKAACEGRLVLIEAELAKAEGRTYETGEQLLARILADRRKNWHGRGKYKDPVLPDTTNLPSLPEGWVWVTVEQLSATIVDCPHSTARFVADGMPCVDTTCIKPGRIVRKNLRFVSRETYEKRVERLTPAHGDIVFAREGTVGTAVVIPKDLNPCLGQRVMLMRPDACVLSAYFEHCLNSQVVRSQFVQKIIGSTAPHLNVAEVRRLALPLPPLAEQTRIVAEVERRLSVIEELEATVVANLQRAIRLRQSILQRVFGDPVRLNSK